MQEKTVASCLNLLPLPFREGDELVRRVGSSGSYARSSFRFRSRRRCCSKM